MKNAKKYILGIFVGRAPLLFDCRVADTKSEVGPTHVNHQSSRHAPIDDCMHEIHVVDRHFSIEPDEAESLEFVAGPEEESYPEIHQPRSIHLVHESADEDILQQELIPKVRLEIHAFVDLVQVSLIMAETAYNPGLDPPTHTGDVNTVADCKVDEPMFILTCFLRLAF